MDIIIVADSVDSAEMDKAWGTLGGPQLALVPRDELKEGSSCTHTDKAIFAFSRHLLPSALQSEPDSSPF